MMHARSLAARIARSVCLAALLPAAAGAESFSGRAFAVYVDVPSLGANASTLADSGSLPPEGGFGGAGQLSADIPGVFSANLLHAALAGARYEVAGARVDSGASLADLVLLPGHAAEVRAAFLRADAEAAESGVRGWTQIEGLTFGGLPVAVTGLPNQRVALPGATLVIDEQTPSAAGTPGIRVAALHLVLDSGEEVVLASAESAVDPFDAETFAAQRSPDRGPCFDAVSGSGWFAPTPAGPKRASFGFDVGQGADGAITGNLGYVDKNSHMRVKATTITRYDKTGPISRSFEGLADVDGVPGVTFLVEVFDDPGGEDRFRIALGNGYAADSGGADHPDDPEGIDGGRIKLQQPCPSPDTAPPTVAITSPSSGATVSGTVTVTGSASDDVGVAGVQFYADGVALGSEDTAAPYSAVWDTTQSGDGTHTLTAVARDGAGNTATSSPVEVTVSNGGVGGDVGTTGRLEEDDPSIVYVAPDLWYDRFSVGYSGGKVKASPYAGQRATLTFSGTGVTFIGYRASNTGIARIYLDGTLVAEIDTFAPIPLFQQPLYTASGLAAGVHTLTVEVTGNFSTLTGSAWIAVDAFDVTSSTTSAGATVSEGSSTTWPSRSGPAPTPSAAVEGVSWTALVNVTASGSTLRKTSGCDGCEDAGAVSSQTIGSAGGYFEFTASELTTSRVAGLSHGNSNTTRADIDFGIQLWPGGGLEVREKGAYRAGGSYVTGDLLRVSVQSGVVRYYRNGTLLHTSGATPTFPLRVDTSLYSLNATIASAVVSGSSSGGDVTPPTVAIASPSNGATVSGTVTVSANASDDVGVAGVRFFADGAPIGTEDTTAPYARAWDTTSVADGSHTLTAVARDAAGNTSTSSPVVVTVSNGGGGGGGTPERIEEDDPGVVYVQAALWYDRFSPGYSQGKVHASPHAGQRATLTFVGTGVTFIGYRASNTGIARFYLDGALVAEVDTWAPVPVFQQPLYSVSGLPRTTHTLTVEVTGTFSTPTGSAWIAVDAFDVVP